MSIATAPRPQDPIAKPRLDYLDNLRSFVIFLVVVMHANATYSGYGRWYYAEVNPSQLDFISRTIFGLYGCFTQAWFMGILFFLAAYFAAKSLAKRGPLAFIKERLFRLGIPVLVFVLVVDPIIRFYLMDYGNALQQLGIGKAYLDYLSSFAWVGAAGPLWFVEALLGFSLIYAGFRALRPAKLSEGNPPKSQAIVLLILGTGLFAFAIRLVMPIGALFGNFLIGYFGAYIVLFWLGTQAGEKDWLGKMPFRTGLRWFCLTLGLGMPLWGVIMLTSGADQGVMRFNGGFNWPSLAYACWESAIAIGFSLGIIAVFQRFFNIRTAWTAALAKSSFGTYVFHTPILVAVSLLLQPWLAHPLLKAGAAGLLCYAATIGFTLLIVLRLPGLKAVMK